MNTSLTPWAGIVIVLLGVTLLMKTLSFYQARFSPDPEWVRKLMHVGSGLLALSFPWLFKAIWPVLLLAFMSALGMLAVRRCATLQKHVGGVLGGVKRCSLGEIYFPLGIGLLFVLAGGQPLHYAVPLLVLTFADTAAALVGSRRGRLHFSISGGEKSVEGSITFFFFACACVCLPLAIFAERLSAEIGLVSVLVALGLTLVEAMLGHGLDNLAIPTLGFFLFDSALSMPTGQLVFQIVSISLILVVALLSILHRLRLQLGVSV